jgi:hypothetical protein
LEEEVMAATQTTFLSLSPTLFGHEVVAGGCHPCCHCLKRAQVIDPASPHSEKLQKVLEKMH